MFSFLPLINSSVNLRLSCYYLAYEQSYHQQRIIFCVFYSGFILQCFYKYLPYRLSLRVIKMLYAFISGCWFITLNNVFAFPDPDTPNINIFNGWSIICDQFGLCLFIFSFQTSSTLIIFVSFFYIDTFNLFFFAY